MLPDEGDTVTCTVTRITPFGVIVDLGDGVEGAIHVTELARYSVLHPEEVVAVGDVIRAKVLSLNLFKGRVGLSERLARGSS
jgi:small subunit ribosomal protein S1